MKLESNSRRKFRKLIRQEKIYIEITQHPKQTVGQRESHREIRKDSGMNENEYTTYQNLMGFCLYCA